MLPLSRPLITVLLVLAAGTALAQDGLRAPSIYAPQSRAAWTGDAAIGLSLLTVPRDIAEEELNKAPALDLNAVYGLPWNFSLTGRALVQVLTNSVHLGARWSVDIGPFAAAVGDESAFCFGFMTVDGFDNSMQAWLNAPNIAIGLDAGDVRFTVKAELMLVLALRTYAGENQLGSTKNVSAGWALTGVIEQPFWKRTHVLLGARVALTQFHPQTWFAFSTFNRRLLFSELIFGVML